MRKNNNYRRALEYLELAVCLIYLGWLVFLVILWGSERMALHRVANVVSLVFSLLISVLLCWIRRLPQVRAVRSGLTARRNGRIVRSRLWWIGSVKLVMVCGFAGMSISMVFSQILRMILAVLTILALVGVSIRFGLEQKAVLSDSVRSPR